MEWTFKGECCEFMHECECPLINIVHEPFYTSLWFYPLSSSLEDSFFFNGSCMYLGAYHIDICKPYKQVNFVIVIVYRYVRDEQRNEISILLFSLVLVLLLILSFCLFSMLESKDYIIRYQHEALEDPSINIKFMNIQVLAKRY